MSDTHDITTGGGMVNAGDIEAQNVVGRDQYHIQKMVVQIAEQLPKLAQDAPPEDWPASAERYRKAIYESCNRIRLLGRSETKPLDAMYTDVYVLPERIARQRYAVDLNVHFKRDLDEYGRDNAGKRLHALDLLPQRESQRLFILGKPGAGKTTFLRHVAMQAAQGQWDKLPIFVTLRDWSERNLSLLDYIVAQFELHHFPRARAFVQTALEQGRALLLFDGLDEVNIQNKKRDTVIRAIKDICTQYARAQCLLTCRNAAEDYSFEGFRYVEVADFTDAQVQRFAAQWFAPKSVDTETDSAKAFLDALAQDAHKGIRELCKTPLLMTLVCMTFEETRNFPPRRAELYQEAINGLLVKWDSARGIKRDDVYGRLSLGRKRQLLMRLAHAGFERHEIFFKLSWLARQAEQFLAGLPANETGVREVDGAKVIKMIEAQHGLLVERAHEVYSFSHLTVQEYFTAEYYHQHPDKLPNLFTAARMLDDRWREVFLLTASLWDEADGFLGGFGAGLQTLVVGWRAHPALFSIAKYAFIKTKDRDGADVRLFYVIMSTVALDRALDLARARDLALDRARDLALALALDRARALDLARALALDLARARALDRALDLDLALDLARALARDLARDLEVQLGTSVRLDWQLIISAQIADVVWRSGPMLDLPKTWLTEHRAWHQDVLATAQRVHQPALVQRLQGVTLPNRLDDKAAWRSLADQLWAVLRELGWPVGLDIRREEINLLNQYFAANKLYLDCLAVASVSERERFKNLAVPLPVFGPDEVPPPPKRS